MHNRHQYNSQKAIIPVLLGAVAAGIAAYWLIGKKKNSRSLHGWYYKLKGEILDQIEDIRNLTREGYERIVDETGRQYAGLKNVDRNELSEALKEMKKHWESIREQMRRGREGYGMKDDDTRG